MSDWIPKVGDRVMVGEHGPYEVRVINERYRTATLLLDDADEPQQVFVGTAKWSWLTPAPEPEPEEPTAPGALVRNSEGILLFRTTGDASRWHEVMTPGGGYWEWDEIARPVTVILADPAEVETLRAEVDGLREDVKRAEARADELQRRINTALALTGPRDKLYDTWLTQGAILRGES